MKSDDRPHKGILCAIGISASEGEHANWDARGGGRLPGTPAGRKRERTVCAMFTTATITLTVKDIVEMFGRCFIHREVHPCGSPASQSPPAVGRKGGFAPCSRLSFAPRISAPVKSHTAKRERPRSARRETKLRLHGVRVLERDHLLLVGLVALLPIAPGGGSAGTRKQTTAIR